MAEIHEEHLEEVLNSSFEIVDGLLLRKGCWSDKSLKEWKETLDGEKSRIESVINYIHLVQFYWLAEDEYLEQEDLLLIGYRIQAAWKKKLAIDFPELDIDVIFESDIEPDGYIGDMNVTVQQA